MRNHKIVGEQFDCRVGGLEPNAERMAKAIRRHKVPGRPVVVVFPEMALPGYPLQDQVRVPAFVRECKEVLERVICPATDANTAALVGLPWMGRDGKPYNAVAWVADGKVLHVFKKMELPNDSVFDEVRNYRPGKPSVFTWHGIVYGVAICEDVWHRRVCVRLKKLGAQIILSPNASPYDFGKWVRREKVLQERVKDAEVPLLYINRWGGQDELVFDGQSALMQPDGSSVRCAMYKDARITFMFDGKRTSNVKVAGKFVQKTWGEECFRHLLVGMKYLKSSRSGKAVLGLSGGIDSAVVYVLGVLALGVNNVTAISMPSRFSSDGSKTDAQALVDAFGGKMITVLIENTVHAMRRTMSEAFAKELGPLTGENLQARTRGVINMAASNEDFGWVLTTGNKSEMAVGYATLYGDMNGAFNPIKDLYKTEVFKLTRWLIGYFRRKRNVAAAEALQRILDKPPSAELRENQQDTDSLPPYEVLDAVLREIIEEFKVPSEITIAGVEPETVWKVYRLVRLAEFKRRQACPGPRWNKVDLDKDWRMPLDNPWQPKKAA